MVLNTVNERPAVDSLILGLSNGDYDKEDIKYALSDLLDYYYETSSDSYKPNDDMFEHAGVCMDWALSISSVMIGRLDNGDDFPKLPEGVVSTVKYIGIVGNEVDPNKPVYAHTLVELMLCGVMSYLSTVQRVELAHDVTKNTVLH